MDQGTQLKLIAAIEALLVSAYGLQTYLDLMSWTNDWVSNLAFLAGASLF